MPSNHRRVLILIGCVLAVVCLLLAVAPVSATATPPDISCSHCLSTGYAYRCRMPLSSNECFRLSGDAHCVGTECTCCRLEYAKGCERCETADTNDLVEDDTELLGDDL